MKDNPFYPLEPFNYMKYVSISYKGGQLKVSIDYENGKHYNFKKQIGGI